MGVLLQNKAKAIGYLYFSNKFASLSFYSLIQYPIKTSLKRSDLDAFLKKVSRFKKKIKSTNEFVPRWYSLFQLVKLIHQ